VIAMLRARFFAMVLLLVGFASLDAADWPVFRGNASQSGVATSKLPDKLAIVWQFKAGRNGAIEGAPAIADGVVYVGSFDEHLYAIDLESGKQKWKTKLAPIKGSPSVQKDRVYVGDIDGKFYCIGAADGRTIWTFEMGAEITSGANFYKDLILIGSHDQTLYAIDKDGKKRWEVKTDGPVNGSPAIVGNKTFVAGCDSILHILDADTGKELNGIDLGGQAAATAAVDGDSLYVGTMTNEVLGIDLKKNEIIWKFEAPKRKLPFYSSAAITEKLVLVGGRDKHLYGLDRKTGNEVWSFLVDEKIDGSPVVVGDRVYFGTLSDDGIFYVLDAKKGTEIQRIELDGPVIGSPAVGENCLVVGTENGVIYCLGSPKK